MTNSEHSSDTRRKELEDRYRHWEYAIGNCVQSYIRERKPVPAWGYEHIWQLGHLAFEILREAEKNAFEALDASMSNSITGSSGSATSSSSVSIGSTGTAPAVGSGAAAPAAVESPEAPIRGATFCACAVCARAKFQPVPPPVPLESRPLADPPKPSALAEATEVTTHRPVQASPTHEGWHTCYCPDDESLWGYGCDLHRVDEGGYASSCDLDNRGGSQVYDGNSIYVSGVPYDTAPATLRRPERPAAPVLTMVAEGEEQEFMVKTAETQQPYRALGTYSYDSASGGGRSPSPSRGGAAPLLEPSDTFCAAASIVAAPFVDYKPEPVQPQRSDSAASAISISTASESPEPILVYVAEQHVKRRFTSHRIKITAHFVRLNQVIPESCKPKLLELLASVRGFVDYAYMWHLGNVRGQASEIDRRGVTRAFQGAQEARLDALCEQAWDLYDDASAHMTCEPHLFGNALYDMLENALANLLETECQYISAQEVHRGNPSACRLCGGEDHSSHECLDLSDDISWPCHECGQEGGHPTPVCPNNPAATCTTPYDKYPRAAGVAECGAKNPAPDADTSHESVLPGTSDEIRTDVFQSDSNPETTSEPERPDSAVSSATSEPLKIWRLEGKIKRRFAARRDDINARFVSLHEIAPERDQPSITRLHATVRRFLDDAEMRHIARLRPGPEDQQVASARRALKLGNDSVKSQVLCLMAMAWDHWDDGSPDLTEGLNTLEVDMRRILCETERDVLPGPDPSGTPNVFIGYCRSCGEDGHRDRDCPDLGAPFIIVCFICGQEGHTSRDCPTQPNVDDFNNRPVVHCFECGDPHDYRDCPFALDCYKCGKQDHLARECPDGPCYRCGDRGHRAEICASHATHSGAVGYSTPRPAKPAHAAVPNEASTGAEEARPLTGLNAESVPRTERKAAQNAAATHAQASPAATALTEAKPEEMAKTRAELFHTVTGVARALATSDKTHALLDSWVAKFAAANE